MNINTCYHILTLIVFSVSGTLASYAQCNDTLVKTALYNSGGDALFIRDFKIKFTKGKTGHPAKVAKYSVYLNDSTTYRFNVVNAKEYDGKAVLQLYSDEKLYGSTYDFDSLKYKDAFDFKCPISDYYMVYMSFLEGETGCAAAVLSMVVNDNTYIREKEEPEFLYENIENPLYIAYTEEPNCYLRVMTSNGKITGYNGKYTVIPDTTGMLIITAQTVDGEGTVIEEFLQEFKVIQTPDPVIAVNGNRGGMIDLTDLIASKKITLIAFDFPESEKYKIINFDICENLSNFNCKNSENEFFSYRQIEFLEKLKPGSRIQISNVKILKPDGNIITLKPLEFILK
jgi:hypothetical protein